MNLDDRIQQAVDAVIQQARSFLETEVRALADHAVASYTKEREEAAAEAAKAKAAEIEEAVRQARDAAQAEHEAALAEQKAEHERQQELSVQEARSAALAEAAATLATLKAESDQAIAAARAESDQAVAAAKAEHEEQLAALKSGHQEQLAAAKTEHEQQLAMARAESDQALAAARAEADEAVAAARAEAEQALAAAKADAEQTLLATKAEADRAIAAVKAEADQSLAAATAEFERALTAAKAESEEALAAKAESEQKLADAQASAAGKLATTEDKLASTEDKLASTEDRLAATESELAAAETEIAGLKEALAAGGAEGERKLADAQASAASALAAAEREIADLEEALAAARTTAAFPAASRLSEAVTEAQLGERRADLACSERLLEFARRSDRASSLTEILDSLADYAHAEVGRAALFLVQGRRLRGWRVLGFENVPDEGRGVEADVDATAVIARAVHTGEPAATSDVVSHADEQGAGKDLPALLALTAGRAGLATPVHVGRQVVAVLYTDEGGGEPPRTPSAWPEIVEVATRHAGRCLEVLTASRVAAARSVPGAEQVAAHRVPQAAVVSSIHGMVSSPTERALAEEEGARRYARLLVSEIKLYNEAAVAEGKQAHSILARLRPEIDRARRLYEEKFPAAVGARVHWFNEELVKTLADGDRSLLGK